MGKRGKTGATDDLGQASPVIAISEDPVPVGLRISPEPAGQNGQGDVAPEQAPRQDDSDGDAGEDDDEGLDEALESGLEIGFSYASGELERPSLDPNRLGLSSPRVQTRADSPEGERSRTPRFSSTFAGMTRVPRGLPPQSEEVWQDPRFRGSIGRLSERTHEQREDLEAALAQDRRLHAHVFAKVCRALRARSDELKAFDPTAPGARALLAARCAAHESELSAWLNEELPRQLNHYYDEDPVVESLERVLSGLETLPSEVPLEVVVSVAKPGRLARLGAALRLTDSFEHRPVPLRRVLSMALTRSSLYDLEDFFAQRQALRGEVVAALDAAARLTREALRSEARVEEGKELELLEEHVTHLCAVLAEAETLIRAPLTHVDATTKGILSALEACHLGLESVPMDAALTATARGDWRSRWLSLRYGFTFVLTRSLARMREGHIRRLELQVLHHPELHTALRDLSRRVNTSLVGLRGALEADTAMHRAAFLPLDEAFAKAKERLASVFDTSQRPAAMHRSLKFLIRRQLKSVYRVYERVTQELEAELKEDELLAAVRATRHELEQLPGQLPLLQLSFPRAQTPAVRLFQTLRILGQERQQGVALGRIVGRREQYHRFWELQEFEPSLEEFRAATQTGAGELWNIVRYNLEGAVADVEEELEDFDTKVEPADEKQGEVIAAACLRSQKNAMGGLERAQGRLKAMSVELGEFHSDIELTFSEKVDFSAGVRSDCSAAVSTRGWLRVTAAAGWLALQQSSHRWRKLVRHLQRGGKAAAVVGTERFREAQNWGRGLLGLTVASLAEDHSKNEVALAMQKSHGEHLPPVYRRLFSLEPLDFDEFLVAREEEFAALDAVVRRWESGLAASVALHGDPGSGKRSFLNCSIDRAFAQKTIRRIHLNRKVTQTHELVEAVAKALELEGVTDLTRLEQALNALEPCVLILERAQNAFLRHIGGFEALRALLVLLSRTSVRHLWVVVFEGHSFAVLQRLFRIGDAFTRVIAFDGLSVEEIRHAITVRHEPSGYDLDFRLDEQTALKLKRPLRSARNNPELQRAIISGYFYDQLHQFSGGNLYVAFYLWLRAVKGPDASRLDVEPVTSLQSAAMERMSQDQFFAAAAILLHGELNVSQMAQVFDWDLIKCRLLLQYFEQHVIVLRRDDGETQDHDSLPRTINPLLLKPLVGLLQRRHIVY